MECEVIFPLFSKYMRYQWAICLRSIHHQRTHEEHCPGNHSLSQINYENVLHTFITAAEWQRESWLAACERGHGKWYHVQFFLCFRVLCCAVGPTGRRPFKAKQKAETSTAKCSTIACRALVSAESCAFFFLLRLPSAGVAFDLCGALCIVYLRDLFEVNARSAGKTPEKFSSLTRVRKRIFRSALFFFFHFRFSVSSPVNAIVDRNPLVNSVQRRQSRRKESQRVCVALKCF